MNLTTININRKFWLAAPVPPRRAITVNWQDTNYIIPMRDKKKIRGIIAKRGDRHILHTNSGVTLRFTSELAAYKAANTRDIKLINHTSPEAQDLLRQVINTQATGGAQ